MKNIQNCLKSLPLVNLVTLVVSTVILTSHKAVAQNLSDKSTQPFSYDVTQSPTEAVRSMMQAIFEKEIGQVKVAGAIECAFQTDAEYLNYKNNIQDPDLKLSDEEFKTKVQTELASINILQSEFTYDKPVQGDETLSKCYLNKQEIHAIQFYTGSGYSDLNRSLREKNLVRIKGYRLVIKTLNAALDKIKNFVGYVKRGTTVPKVLLREYTENQLVTHPYYTSTSVGYGFGGTLRYVIYSRHCKNISKLSVIPSEEEILCKPGTQFVVKYRDDSADVTKVLLEEIDQNFDVDKLIQSLEAAQAAQH